MVLLVFLVASFIANSVSSDRQVKSSLGVGGAQHWNLSCSGGQCTYSLQVPANNPTQIKNISMQLSTVQNNSMVMQMNLGSISVEIDSDSSSWNNSIASLQNITQALYAHYNQTLLKLQKAQNQQQMLSRTVSSTQSMVAQFVANNSCYQSCINSTTPTPLTLVCQNNASSNGSYCVCQIGWNGRQCDNIVCLNGGTYNASMCLCPPMYYGVHCEMSNSSIPLAPSTLPPMTSPVSFSTRPTSVTSSSNISTSSQTLNNNSSPTPVLNATSSSMPSQSFSPITSPVTPTIHNSSTTPAVSSASISAGNYSSVPTVLSSWSPAMSSISTSVGNASFTSGLNPPSTPAGNSSSPPALSSSSRAMSSFSASAGNSSTTPHLSPASTPAGNSSSPPVLSSSSPTMSSISTSVGNSSSTSGLSPASTPANSSLPPAMNSSSPAMSSFSAPVGNSSSTSGLSSASTPAGNSSSLPVLSSSAMSSFTPSAGNSSTTPPLGPTSTPAASATFSMSSSTSTLPTTVLAVCPGNMDPSSQCSSVTCPSNAELSVPGSFLSPYYPTFYGNNDHCLWKLNSGNTSSIVYLQFHKFRLEASQSCSGGCCDSLTMYDGPSTSSPPLGTHCGQSLNPMSPNISVIISTGQYMTVVFSSDGSMRRKRSVNNFEATGCNSKTPCLFNATFGIGRTTCPNGFICQNGGICLPSNTGFDCQCPQYFIGDTCQTPQLPCDTNPCQHGGTCTNTNSNTTFSCSCPSPYHGSTCNNAMVSDCSELKMLTGIASAGVYNMTQLNIMVYCDTAGYTYIQHRTGSATPDFAGASLISYKNGFGSSSSDHWLGLNNIQSILKHSDTAKYDMLVVLTDCQGTTLSENFLNFTLSPAPDFSINYDSSRGDAGDAISGQVFNQRGQPFSVNSCFASGGWWFYQPAADCYGFKSNLNGQYFANCLANPQTAGIRWAGSWTKGKSLLRTIMKIKRNDLI